MKTSSATASTAFGVSGAPGAATVTTVTTATAVTVGLCPSLAKSLEVFSKYSDMFLVSVSSTNSISTNLPFFLSMIWTSVDICRHL